LHVDREEGIDVRLLQCDEVVFGEATLDDLLDKDLTPAAQVHGAGRARSLDPQDEQRHCSPKTETKTIPMAQRDFSKIKKTTEQKV